MPTITPNGTVKLLKNVPFTNNYAHSIYFSSVSEQVTYMNSKVDKTLTAQNYIKEEQGSIRLQAQEENARDWCYMMWENPDLGRTPAPANTRWMYAFITQIDFVSPKVVRIHYEIDVLQTYALFNVTFKECLIERRHTASDNLFEHLEPENIGFGAYKYDKLSSLIVNTDFKYLIFSGVDLTQISPSTTTPLDEIAMVYPYMAGGLPQGVKIFVCETATTMSNLVGGLRSGLADAILAIVAVPAGFVSAGTDGGEILNNDDYHKSVATGRYTDIDGYVPNNNRLYAFPFNMLNVTTLEGEQNDYQWEYFDDIDDIHFDLTLGITTNPELIAVPENYAGKAQAYDERVTLKNFPHVCFMGNYFLQWQHDKAANILGGMVSAALGSAGNFGVTLPVKGESQMYVNDYNIAMYRDLYPSQPGSVKGLPGIGMATAGAMQSGIEFAKAQTHANTIHGSSAGETALVARKLKNIYCYQKCVMSKDARRIDDFFTTYGYAINRIGTPNFTNGRKNQHFIKTLGCLVVGSCPSEYVAKIEQIFNTGVTWWNKDHVGEYN